MIGIVCSRADEASEHVCEHVLDLGDFEACEDETRPDADGGGTYHRSAAFELRTFDDLHLELDDVADAFGDPADGADEPAYVVFASRHSGDSGALLSAHVTGNFGEAEYGGADRSLAAAPPNALAAVLDRLEAHAPEGYDVALECTHHGPSEVGVPSMFVELGSGPEQWADPDGAAAVARAILDLATVPALAPPERASAAADPEDDAHTRRHVVGFGGGHYAPRFTRVALETDWRVGHVAADWQLEELGDPQVHRDVVASAFERSAAERALVEGDRPELVDAIESLGHRVVGETWLRETDGVPLALVEFAEDLLAPVERGLRFGAAVGAAESGTEGADTGDGELDLDALAVVELPRELLEVAQGVDREAVLDALDATLVAYETEENGTRVGDRALVDARASSSAPDSRSEGAATDDGAALPPELRERLLDLLRRRYDEVSVEDGRVVATETSFDPEKARTLGVPEGPKFGRLSSGEPVEVHGETIDPEVVRTEREDVFEL